MIDYSAFDLMLDPIIVIDEQKGIVYRNESFAALCGIPVRRIKIGTLIHQLIHIDDPELFLSEKGLKGKDAPTSYKEVTFSLNKPEAGATSKKVQIAIQPCPSSPSSADRHWLAFLKDVTLEEALHRKYRTELAQKEMAHQELDEYARTLEAKIQQRTAEIASINRVLRAILESLGQGFLSFDSAGGCLPVFSKACLTILEGDPSGKKIWEVLRVPKSEIKAFHAWLETLFSEPIPFEDLVELGPRSYPHSEGKRIQLEFYAIRSENEKIEAVVLVSTDVTREFDATERADRERDYVAGLLKLLRYKRQFIRFSRDLLAWTENPFMDIPALRRALHTYKGGAATFGVDEVHRHLHALEERSDEELTRGISQKMDELRASLLSFLIARKDALGLSGDSIQLNSLGATVEIEVSRLEQFNRLLSEASAVPGPVKEAFEREFIFEPLELLFRPFEETVRSLSKALSKPMLPLQISGGEDRVRIERFEGVVSSLVHCIRNAVSHGIESPEERRMCAKPEMGRVAIEIQRGQKKWIIKVLDDGKGIEPQKIRAKLLKIGVSADELDRLSDKELIQGVFRPGFTTTEGVDEVSGRGVGMDAVSVEATRMGGRVWVESTQGSGTQVVLEIPVL